MSRHFILIGTVFFYQSYSSPSRLNNHDTDSYQDHPSQSFHYNQEKPFEAFNSCSSIKTISFHHQATSTSPPNYQNLPDSSQGYGYTKYYF